LFLAGASKGSHPELDVKRQQGQCKDECVVYDDDDDDDDDGGASDKPSKRQPALNF
jgi:hypothetical protein